MRKQIILLGFLLALSDARADVASDFYHPAAAAYIQGDTLYASNQVARGLTIEPDHAKLLRLKELLENQSESSSDSANPPPSSSDDTSANEPSSDPAERASSPERDGTTDAPQPDSSDASEGAGEAIEPIPPASLNEPMQRDEAEQLLDALREDEQDERRQLRPIMGRPIEVEKDW